MIRPAAVALGHPQRDAKLVEVPDERQPGLDIFTSTIAAGKIALPASLSVLVLWWRGAGCAAAPSPSVTGCHPPPGFWPPARQTTLVCADESKKPGNQDHPGRPGQSERPRPLLLAVVDAEFKQPLHPRHPVVLVIQHNSPPTGGRESAPSPFPGAEGAKTHCRGPKFFAARQSTRDVNWSGPRIRANWLRSCRRRRRAATGPSPVFSSSRAALNCSGVAW